MNEFSKRVYIKKWVQGVPLVHAFYVQCLLFLFFGMCMWHVQCLCVISLCECRMYDCFVECVAFRFRCLLCWNFCLVF